MTTHRVRHELQGKQAIKMGQAVTIMNTRSSLYNAECNTKAGCWDKVPIPDEVN